MKSLKLFLLTTATAAMALTACSSTQDSQTTASGLNPAAFDSVVNNIPVKLYQLKNSNGMEVDITNFGGRVVSICVPDRDGKTQDVVHGFDNLRQYTDIENSPSDFGAAIGRYANRINKGQITIEGKTIQLPTNNFGHCLHGGPLGWQYQVYEAEQLNDSTLRLTMNSKDGDMNFPGNVKAIVTYTVTNDNALDIAYEATTDKTTVINMTNHSYFNLSGDPKQTILEDSLYVNASNFTPVDDTYMTTGEIKSVEGTLFDFTKMKTIGQDITEDNLKNDEQLRNGNGYDHNWVLDTKGDDTVPAAILKSAKSGIMLTVYTNEPGIQVYTGNFLDGKAHGKRGIDYQQRTAICLETQKYPDTPNKPEWPSATLKPGETYKSHCVFKFSTF
ncbi:MAG: aldose epimerase family protein [Prevotella sp.]